MVILKRLIDLIAQEPALFAALVASALVLLVAFGVHISGPQQDAIKGFVGVVVIIIGAFFVRSQVTPVAGVNPVPAPPPAPPAA